MLIKRPEPIAPSEITPESVYQARRRFLALGAAGAGALLLPRLAGAATLPPVGAFGTLPSQALAGGEALTPLDSITSYCNFYELGTGKSDPARNAESLRTSPWRVRIGGEVARPGDYTLEDILQPHTLEERIYRLRCVEAWSMVVPWVGFPLADLLKRFEPTSRAKYVAFTTLYDPEQMPGQRRSVLEWPYREGLRIDEAMHPLTLLAVGLYGQTLPKQNGAPLRLVVPWKYGFKSIKSIVAIDLVESQPTTTWNQMQSSEYGFYANVNPAVDHPRWSQARERRIGEFFKRDTLAFNGYAEQVAGLYRGMDLRRQF